MIIRPGVEHVDRLGCCIEKDLRRDDLIGFLRRTRLCQQRLLDGCVWSKGMIGTARKDRFLAARSFSGSHCNVSAVWHLRDLTFHSDWRVYHFKIRPTAPVVV